MHPAALQICLFVVGILMHSLPTLRIVDDTPFTWSAKHVCRRRKPNEPPRFSGRLNFFVQIICSRPESNRQTTDERGMDESGILGAPALRQSNHILAPRRIRRACHLAKYQQ